MKLQSFPSLIADVATEVAGASACLIDEGEMESVMTPEEQQYIAAVQGEAEILTGPNAEENALEAAKERLSGQAKDLGLTADSELLQNIALRDWVAVTQSIFSKHNTALRKEERTSQSRLKVRNKAGKINGMDKRMKV